MARARRRSSSEIEMSKSDVLHVLQHGTVIASEPFKREPGTPVVRELERHGPHRRRSHSGREERASAMKAIIRVGDGRGFLLKTIIGNVVVTAGHCLPHVPPAEQAAGAEQRMYADLLGVLDSNAPRASCECLFFDAVADVAVLGEPEVEKGVLPEDICDSYLAFVEDRPALRLGTLPRTTKPGVWTGPVWLLTLDGQWEQCTAQHYPQGVRVEGSPELAPPGMSGSPILTNDGRAIAVMTTGDGTQAPNGSIQWPVALGRTLVKSLPGWLLTRTRNQQRRPAARGKKGGEP